MQPLSSAEFRVVKEIKDLGMQLPAAGNMRYELGGIAGDLVEAKRAFERDQYSSATFGNIRTGRRLYDASLDYLRSAVARISRIHPGLEPDFGMVNDIVFTTPQEVRVVDRIKGLVDVMKGAEQNAHTLSQAELAGALRLTANQAAATALMLNFANAGSET